MRPADAQTIPGPQAADENSFRDYAKLFAWAEGRGLGRTLSNLLLASGAKSTGPTNMCVQFLAIQSVWEVLSQWADTDDDAAELLALSDALRDSPEILSQFLADPNAQPLEERFKGVLGDWPMLLCQGVRRPGGDPKHEFWFDQLRVWLVIQAFTRAKDNQTCSKLATVAMRLRMAGENSDPAPMRWFVQLRAAPVSVQALSRHLRSRTAQVPPERDGHRNLLTALRDVARGDRHPFPDGDEDDRLTGHVRSLRARSPVQARSHFSPEVVVDVSTIESLPALDVDVRDAPNHTARLLKGRGELIRSAEELQYLRWSWDTPTPSEQSELVTQLSRWDASKDPSLRLLAFMCRVAVITSRSLAAMQSLAVSNIPSADWTITSDLRKLHRSPPRRAEGWRSGRCERKWLRALADRLELDIAAYSPAVVASSAATLSDVWQGVSPNEAADALFNRLCRETAALRRISSAQLQRLFARNIYDVGADAVLAQLLTSGSGSGLGANCAYASWRLESLRASFSKATITCELTGPDECNAAGSELDPLDRRLRRSVQAAERRIAQLAHDPDRWLDHHNALVAYVVAALLAATGGRIVSDPFESPEHFDWSAGRLFLADKATRAGSGRLVPLPSMVLVLVEETYCRHLTSLAQILRTKAGVMADEVERLASRKQSSALPFFFFLGAKPSLHWYSVSEATLARQRLFSGRLPWNVGRHRLSTRLRAAGVDAEVIDSLLGHADQQVLTHGDQSPRTWANDMREAMPALQEAYAALGFAASLPLGAETDSRAFSVDGELLHLTPFGNAAREQKRRETMQQQVAEAVNLYNTTLAGRSPEKVSPVEWEQLALSLVKKSDGRPHPYARVRYRVLERRHSNASRECKLRLRRMFVFREELQTPFHPSAVGCEERLQALQRWFEGRPAHPQPSRLGVAELLALAALDMMLVSRITSKRLLSEVLERTKDNTGKFVRNFRVVIHRSQAFLEYHPMLSQRPDAPVVRYRVSRRCAEWLGAVTNEGYERDPGKMSVPERWRAGLPLSEQPNVRALVLAIAEVVEQANFIQRPGLIAAYAAGRVDTAALPHASWRLYTEDVVPAKSTAIAASSKAAKSRVPLPSAVSKWKPGQTSDAEAAERMFKAMRTTLATHPPEKKKPDGARDRRHRGRLATKLAEDMRKEADHVSSAVWALGSWVVAMIARGRKDDPEYEISSVLRYLTALSRRFIDVGSHFDLLEADPESIVDFYDEVLELDRELDLTYVVGRLQAFHQFARHQFSIEDVDWGELDCGTVVPHGSPGIVGARQYLNSLELLVPSVSAATHEALARGFLLILSYRFGLRGADAIGLQSRDWHAGIRSDRDPGIVVHVRSNLLRKLKRPTSRRIVPQIEDFSPLESAVVITFLRTYEGQRAKNPDFPLFASDRRGKPFKLRTLTGRINATLHQVHSDGVSLHKGRHSYCCRLAEALMGDALRPQLAQRTTPAARRLRELFLGSSRVTRRAVWALGRAMGHARPAMSFRSYVHWLPFWFDEWSAPEIDRLDKLSAGKCKGDVMLERGGWIRWEPVLSALEEPTPAAVTLARLATFLDEVRGGIPMPTAARNAGVSPQMALGTVAAIERATATLRPINVRRGRDLPSLLLHIHETQWTAIREACKDAKLRPTSPRHVPPSLQSGLQLLTLYGKIVLWQWEHFDWISGLVRTFRLSPAVVILMSTPRLPDRIRGWIKGSGLAGHFRAGQAKRGHVDSVTGYQRGLADRCALTVRAHAGMPATNYGLALLWAIYLSALCADQRGSSAGE